MKKGIDRRRRVWYNVTDKEEELSVLTSPQRRVGSDISLILGELLGRGDWFFSVFIYFWRCIPISAKEKEMLINEDIRFPQVRVIGSEGETLGIMKSQAALEMAYDKGLDLVLMAAQSDPPVCKIMDYGRFRFERDKREKEAKKKQVTVELKEVQLSCRIETHDFETKARNAIKFLQQGNKVRVVLRFKGREMSHLDIGREVIEKFRAAVEEFGTVDKAPSLDGRFLSMVVSPIKNK